MKDATGEVCFDLDFAKANKIPHRITVQKKLSPMITVSDGVSLANLSKFLKTMLPYSIYKLL